MLHLSSSEIKNKNKETCFSKQGERKKILGG